MDTKNIPTIDDRDTPVTDTPTSETNTPVTSDTPTTHQLQTTPFTDGEAMRAALTKAGEELGQFKEYDSQLPLADIKGTRVVKCLYQANKDTGKKIAENSYVRVPLKHLTEEHIVNRAVELAPYILDWLQGIEDSQIKEQHKKGGLQIYTEYLSLDKIIERLEELGTSNRLTKDMIESWFNDEIRDSLELLFADKLEIDLEADEVEAEDLQKLGLILEAYKKKFSSLASGKTFIEEEECDSMIQVIEAVGCDKSIMGVKYIAKLTAMRKKENDTLVSLC